MSRLAALIGTLLQVGLGAAWLFSGASYAFAPASMAHALGLSDAVRVGLGALMAALGLVMLVAVVARRSALAIGGAIALAALGTAFAAYDAVRHWVPFAVFDGALAALAITIVIMRPRRS